MTHFTAMTDMNTNRTSIHMMHFADLRSAKPVFQTDKFIWWGFATIEILLAIRFILEYFDANLTNTLTYSVYQITDYILYPFATILSSSGMSGDGIHGWITVVAIIGYGLLAVALVSLLNAIRSPHSRIEHARALSRRKYSR